MRPQGRVPGVQCKEAAKGGVMGATFVGAEAGRGCAGWVRKTPNGGHVLGVWCEGWREGVLGCVLAGWVGGRDTVII